MTKLAIILKCILFFFWSACVSAEVTVQVVQTIYDKSPKLRIRGTGFGAEDHDILLELGATDQPLLLNRDYLISKDGDGDGLILKLLGNRRYRNACSL